MKAFFVPAWDGEYRFYVNADDEAAVYLNTEPGDINRANMVKIAHLKTWNTYRNYFFNKGFGG